MTTKAEHTSGPWEADDGVISARTPEYWGASQEIARIIDLRIYPHEPFSDESTANARLIAAAPDLLAALKGLQEWAAYMGGWDSPAWSRAFAAVAKATGENN